MKSIIEFIKEGKIEKKYYVGHATATTGCRDLDFVTGPYDTLDEAKIFLDKIAKEYGLNDGDYEWTSHINIYKSTKVDYQYMYSVKKTGKNTYEYEKGKHGGNKYLPVKQNDIPHISEEEFIKRIQEY